MSVNLPTRASFSRLVFYKKVQNVYSMSTGKYSMSTGNYSTCTGKYSMSTGKYSACTERKRKLKSENTVTQ